MPTRRFRCDVCGYEWEDLVARKVKWQFCPLVMEPESSYLRLTWCHGVGEALPSSPFVHGMSGEWGTKEKK